MVGELWTSIKAYLYDRTSSPLLGAIIAGLFVWNFKIVMLFFSSASYAVKVWEIDHFYSQTFFIAEAFGGESWGWSNYIFCVYVMPLLTAIFYIYVFPFFSHKVFEHSYDKQIKLNNKRKTMQDTAILTQEEKEEILNEIEQAKLKSRKDVLDARNEIADLESQRDTLITEKGQLESTLGDASDEKAALVTEAQNLTKQLDSYRTRYEKDDDAQAERKAKTKEAINGLREQFKSSASTNDGSTNDESTNKDLPEVDKKQDVSFFHNAEIEAQEVYRKIFSSLYLGDKNPALITGVDNAQFGEYAPDLMMYGMIENTNSFTYSLTEKGRSFFENLKRTA
ncbi:hypothetical protein BCU70_14860 [Vibrio sp. 10N.286.49.C2]|uniref:hypothetical protein n=1 Tax=unclassified Vibrio TaxID=2614977 RepID=UPI000C840B2D|nr:MULTISPECIES: hypothetical protein [unclassified Vibrio]PMH37704.1 hypothetical protein BCU70_14860 [Vibrio sp. 10N.286.49.C2]PMH45131.1 hypothetical protein BCU66_02140 [Vibrio sp. 10N.286.49.B1]PMH79088.1 hypothetical protein BCU58_06720 [Vibrio sp. 10N.286.48.B7]